MSGQRFAPEFKDEAVRQVLERGYKAPRPIAGRPSIIAPNKLQREFTVEKPDQVWVTDITYIRTWQGWLYLAVVMDLYARRIVGWSMKPTLAREIVIDAILMAVWRRKPRGTLIHSDQGSQYGSDDWLRFCREHHLEPSMSRRGNCWDNAVAESFFSSLKKERIKKRIYKTRDLARADVFDYIEMFYANDQGSSRKHKYGHSCDSAYRAIWLNKNCLPCVADKSIYSLCPMSDFPYGFRTKQKGHPEGWPNCLIHNQ